MFGMSEDMNSMFNAFFAGGPMMGARGGRNRRENRVTHMLPVTLADLYNGKTVTLSRSRDVPCSTCDGSGSKRKKNTICHVCRGSGSRIMLQGMGLLMQQMSTVCEACNGSGCRIEPRDACITCGGRRMKKVESPLSVIVERGMQDKEQILLSSEGDFDPERGQYSDILIVLDQAKNEGFDRNDDDLIMTRQITLGESLCGFGFSFRHLDNRELIIRRERGEITKPGDEKVVLGEGMPLKRNPTQRGDLIIKFEVLFPERIHDSQVELLRRSLPPPKPINMEALEYAEECYVSRAEIEELRKELETEKDAPEEFDGTPEVECVSQ